jgi:hypothetical protein
MRRRKRRLNKADLPTFGRPTMATVGTLDIHCSKRYTRIRGVRSEK